MNGLDMKIVARIRSDFKTKFGIPRQSGLAKSLKATIVFEPEYRNPEALRGIEGYSNLWLIWQFSEAVREDWSPTVRPPRLGGNTRMGVFATRSPFRPNPIGLSCVKLEGVEQTAENGTVLHVSGADLMDGTPILDIKPYVAYSDAHPEALGGFTDKTEWHALEVSIPETLAAKLPPDTLTSLTEVLSCDPRPTYQNDSERVYGFVFAEFEVKFKVENTLLTVISIE